MRKAIIRREFFKLRLEGYSFSGCQKKLIERFETNISLRTLKYWSKKLNTGEWDLNDKSSRPKTIHYKFSKQDRLEAIELRKKTAYSSKQIRIKLQEKGIIMSESYIKQLVKGAGLSRGNKMEGIRLKWVRFERDNPNSMWQLDGTQDDNGDWILPIEDDCSRYCLAIGKSKQMTTEIVITLLEKAIAMHGKPREILTDNGSEFGGRSDWDSDFDKWCKKMGIKHIRSGIHKPTTVGKIGAMQQTIKRELPYCNDDLEAWRYRYNHERPHQSLRMLTPAVVYFQFKRHKKHYEL
jgi:putative transposase|tara:strand:+ start:80 stop:961 length:882 start_codon:yes stop_codon:yes gene_type:complete